MIISSKKLSATVVTVISTVLVATFLLTHTARADVFHGRWIRGAIADTYLSLGGHPALGNAITDEADAAGGGRFQHFERDSSIYWHPEVAGGVARQVGGLIRDQWEESGWERGDLGYPTTNELPMPGRDGRFNHFENGSIYWSPSTGAHPVTGEILEYWESRGWENSHLGLPTSGTSISDGGLLQSFEHGDVHVSLPSFMTLPASDQKPHTSYRTVIPLFPAKTGDDSLVEHLTPAGLTKHVTKDFQSYFPFSGCPTRLIVGATCEMTTVAGMKETVQVSAIADDGFAVTTLDGSPEGAGRTTTFKFGLTEARSTDPDLVFEDEVRRGIFNFAPIDDPWASLTVESFGPIAGAEWAGPFNNRRIGGAAWAKMGTLIVNGVENMDTVYLIEGIPGLDELIDAFKKLFELGARAMRSAPTTTGEVVDTSIITDHLLLEPMEELNSEVEQ